MRRISFILSLYLLLAAIPAAAGEGDGVVISIRQETEVAAPDAHGKEAVKRVPVTTAVPGTTVLYTLAYRNRGAAPATDVVLMDPVPAQMVYRDGSAFGPGTAIEFSVDGGKAFAPLAALTVKDKDGKNRPASASDVTHLRWTLGKPLAPGASGEVGFRAVLR